MKISVKSDYACRAVEALALHHPNERPLRIEEIAQQEAIPANYLVQILNELKSNGLIQSRRGKAGGYMLARPPAEITVGDVLRAVNGEILELSSLAQTAGRMEIQRVWDRLKQGTEQIADGITFDQLCAEANRTPQMYYI